MRVNEHCVITNHTLNWPIVSLLILFYFILFSNVSFCILVHGYTLCFFGSPCYNVSYYNYNSRWPYCRYLITNEIYWKTVTVYGGEWALCQIIVNGTYWEPPNKVMNEPCVIVNGTYWGLWSKAVNVHCVIINGTYWESPSKAVSEHWVIAYRGTYWEPPSKGMNEFCVIANRTYWRPPCMTVHEHCVIANRTYWRPPCMMVHEHCVIANRTLKATMYEGEWALCHYKWDILKATCMTVHEHCVIANRTYWRPPCIRVHEHCVIANRTYWRPPCMTVHEHCVIANRTYWRPPCMRVNEHYCVMVYSLCHLWCHFQGDAPDCVSQRCTLNKSCIWRIEGPKI